MFGTWGAWAKGCSKIFGKLLLLGKSGDLGYIGQLNIRFVERFKGIKFDLESTTYSDFACNLQLAITVLGGNYDPEEHGLAHCRESNGDRGQ